MTSLGPSAVGRPNVCSGCGGGSSLSFRAHIPSLGVIPAELSSHPVSPDIARLREWPRGEPPHARLHPAEPWGVAENCGYPFVDKRLPARSTNIRFAKHHLSPVSSIALRLKPKMTQEITLNDMSMDQKYGSQISHVEDSQMKPSQQPLYQKETSIWAEIVSNPKIIGLSVFANFGAFMYGFDTMSLSLCLSMPAFELVPFKIEGSRIILTACVIGPNLETRRHLGQSYPLIGSHFGMLSRKWLAC